MLSIVCVWWISMASFVSHQIIDWTVVIDDCRSARVQVTQLMHRRYLDATQTLILSSSVIYTHTYKHTHRAQVMC